MDWIIILQAGVASGTVLLFATIGEIFAERSGVLNLGVEGMMLMGAMSAFSLAVHTGNAWLGLLVAMLVGGLLSLLHGLVTIHFQADQVVSGLTLTFLGTGLSLVFGEGLSKAGAISLLPNFSIPLLAQIPLLGPRASWSISATSFSRQPGSISTAPGPACTCAPWANTRPPPTRWVSAFTGCATCTSLWGGCWPGWPGRRSAWRCRRVGSAS